MNKYLKGFYLILFIFNTFIIYAQPVLVGLSNNPVIKNYVKSNPRSLHLKNSTDTIRLPFFDDFSKPGVYPDSSKWIDKYAYINDSYGDNPISVGVATLDILNDSGEVYSTANPFSFIADYLTSKPIDLNYSISDSIFLSFFYQPQGKAYNGPEPKDSLVLEFKSPLDQIWRYVWSVEGSADQPFKQVTFSIKDSIFLKKGFQFRFKNYGSIAEDQSLYSWRSNGDIWNIDWVKLDTGRKNTIIDDVGFVYGSRSFLKDYESIPWTHYGLVSDEQIGAFSMSYINRNPDSLQRNIQRFVKHYNAANIADTTFDLGSENAPWYQIVIDSYNFTYNLFPYDSTRDSSSFLIKSFIVWDTVAVHKAYRWNDTVRYFQKFYNYYAYDDGTPESGYCLMGTDDAQLAYKCYTYKPDTLRAVQIFFNQTFNNASQHYFYLTVWSYKNKLPDKVLYSRIGIKPEYNGLNQFNNYLLDSVIVVSDTFFIGFVQTTKDCLNTGFDFSRDTKSKTYYKISGSWEHSPFEGSLMMRPVFGKQIPLGISENKVYKNDILIYPNPANDIINISLQNFSNSRLLIYNIEGQLIINSAIISNNNKINISNLPKGMYILKIASAEKIYFDKFIKQ